MESDFDRLKQIESDFDRLKLAVAEFLKNESSGHDIFHAERVFLLSKHLQTTEGGDLHVIGCAALVHDLCRPWEKRTKQSHFGPAALEIIRKVLEQSAIMPDSIEKILAIVAEHDIYDWSEKNSEKSIELQIVQDADNLDAIGAIGVARTFMFGGHHGAPMYLPEEDLSFTQDFIDGAAKGTSVIAHFYEKLLKLSSQMNTATGKKIAIQRHTFMQTFLNQFFSEWNVQL